MLRVLSHSESFESVLLENVYDFQGPIYTKRHRNTIFMKMSCFLTLQGLVFFLQSLPLRFEIFDLTGTVQRHTSQSGHRIQELSVVVRIASHFATPLLLIENSQIPEIDAST